VQNAPTSVTKEQLLREILSSRVYDAARETPLDPARRLAEALQNEVLLKREDLQPIFSFKIRGAHNRIAHLTRKEREAGVIAASAGNHAQGVAFSANRVGVRAVIVMPETTPAIKIEAVRRLGAEIVLSGETYADAEVRCHEIATASGLTVIHPFDDPLVIAGQGTIAAEIHRHGGERLGAVFVPVGGGGLIAGIAGYFKEVAPEVRVIGVQPLGTDSMHRSLLAGHPVEVPRVGIFADGVAVRQVGDLTFQIARDTVDEIVLVDNDEICAAIRDVFEDTRSIVEPAGALAVAGMKRWVRNGGVLGQRLVAVLSGANMNFDRLGFVVERAELGEAREAVLAVTIPEHPGAFLEFCRLLGRRTITEFNYRLASRAEAHVFVGIRVESKEDLTELVSSLEAAGRRTVDLSRDETAKLHVRHMVGGRAPETVTAEVACRFEFPERPGALTTFLETLGGRWNISLFHYRNHAADAGRVLAGFEVPEAERAEFLAFLEALGYRYVLELDNAAYRLFLG
jgi:threonine dehydratase